jgi:hypothetical protein
MAPRNPAVGTANRPERSSTYHRVESSDREQ